MYSIIFIEKYVILFIQEFLDTYASSCAQAKCTFYGSTILCHFMELQNALQQYSRTSPWVLH